MTTLFTGLKPTGRLHLGNYLGAVRPLLGLAAEANHDVLVCVVDLHALTVAHDPSRLRRLSMDMAAMVLACGLDPRAALFLQSSVPAHTELSYLVESTATYGELARMVQFKQKSGGQESVRLSLLTYPALMAADILVHRTDVVPVGEDQRQHLELTATLARRFNARYGPVFTVPRPVSPHGVARVKDLRMPSAKMGKTGSDGSGVVYLDDDADTIAEKVRRAVTDADPELRYDPANRPGVANLGDILGALTGTDAVATLSGLHGAAALKRAVTDALVETLAPVRRRYLELTADPAELERTLRRGRDAVTPGAVRTVSAARDAIGLASVA